MDELSLSHTQCMSNISYSSSSSSFTSSSTKPLLPGLGDRAEPHSLIACLFNGERIDLNFRPYVFSLIFYLFTISSFSSSYLFSFFLTRSRFFYKNQIKWNIDSIYICNDFDCRCRFWVFWNWQRSLLYQTQTCATTCFLAFSAVVNKINCFPTGKGIFWNFLMKIYVWVIACLFFIWFNGRCGIQVLKFNWQQENNQNTILAFQAI